MSSAETKGPKSGPMMKVLDWVEKYGNKLPHPFWLFCILIAIVLGLSALLSCLGVVAVTPATEVLQSVEGGVKVDGRLFTIDTGFEPFVIEMEKSSHSSKLNNLYVEIYTDGKPIHEEAIDRSALKSLPVSQERFPVLQEGGTYRIKVVNRSREVPVESLLTKDGLNWFVLSMVHNFAHFEPLGLVLVMLMGVAIAEGAGLIPALMRGIAANVPAPLIIPALFILAACGNVGSAAGVVVIPPLAAAIFKQLGKNPITGLIVGYVGATAGFTANFFPAGTDVLAMSLTNAASGNDPEINVLSNWYFMSASVFFLAVIGTVVTKWIIMPRLGDAKETETEEIERLTPLEKKGLLYAGIGVAILAGIWLITILPEKGWLRNPDPNPDLIWRSNFFKGLIPILFSLFAAGGIVYGKVTGSIRKADDIVGFMVDAMKRMGGYIVLILVIAQFTKMFQYAHLDELIAIKGAELLRAVGMEELPVPFLIAFIVIIALANLFLGSSSAKWAIFAPVFVPMFISLGYHPAFTQLLYRIGDSITNCVSPLYPYFPILLGWIASIDKEKGRVGTVLSLLLPYANFLLFGWIAMTIIWYVLGLPVGPDSPLFLSG